MELIETIFLFFITIFGLYKERNIVNPIFIFNGIWTCVFFLSTVNEYVNKASSETYVMIFLSVLMFDFGCLSLNLVKSHKIRFGTFKIDVVGEFKLRYKLIYLLIGVSLAYYFVNFIFVFSNVGLSGLAAIGSYVTSEDYFVRKSHIINFLYTVIVNPFSYIMPAIAVVDYLYVRKKINIVIWTVIMLAFRLFSSGNRLSFVFIFIYLFFVSDLLIGFSYKRIGAIVKKESSNKLRMIFVASIFIFCIVFGYTTISRGYDIFQNLTINLAIPISMFEMWCDKIDSSNICGYGEASIQGFIYPIFYILKNAFSLPIPAFILDNFNVIESTVIEWVSLGYYEHNAYVSTFWYFYYDFGVVGLFLYPFIIGRVTLSLYNDVKRRTNCKIISLYCMMVHFMLTSYGGCDFANIGMCLGIIMLVFVLYKKLDKKAETEVV